MSKNDFILELNEFNIELLKYYANKFNFDNIKKILRFNKSKTYTNDRYIGDNNQDGYLDPWSQWVSIHTTKESRFHKIKNLGDIPNLKYKQVWEKYKNRNFYIWGPMNASRRSSKNVKFFFPDPWVYSEKAFPKYLNEILDPIKIFTKTRGKISIKKKIKLGTKIFNNIYKLSGFFLILKSLKIIVNGVIKLKIKPIVFIVAWEFLTINIFLKLIKNKKNSISIFFMNSLAHAQHHYWNKNSEEIKFCLNYLDYSIGKIIENKELNLIIISGLSQRNSAKENLCLYEQYSHEKFLKFININFFKIEKLMTNDAFIFFNNKTDTLNSAKMLRKVKFKNEKLFHVEILSNKKIFYKTNFLKRVKSSDKLIINDIRVNFLTFFKFITLRRGIHHHEGSVLSQNKIFPEVLKNHSTFNFIK